jgi:GTP-binding protein
MTFNTRFPVQVVLTSATTGQRTEKLFQSVDQSASQFMRRISTNALNEVVNDATIFLAPPTIGSRAGRIYYCIQVSVAPPTIVLFVNDPALFTDNYQRYLERKVRDALQFEGTPIRMIWRGKSLRDVSRAAKRGAVGAATSGVLRTTMGTTGGERRKVRGKKME